MENYNFAQFAKRITFAVTVTVFFAGFLVAGKGISPKTAKLPYESKLLVKTVLGDWKKVEVPVTGNPATYMGGVNRKYFLSKNKDKGLNVVWQDKTSLQVFITTLAPDLSTSKTRQALVPAKTKLLAAANDENGNFYFAVFTEGAGTVNDFVTLCKTGTNGQLLLQKKLSSLKEDLDIWRIENYGGTMVYSKGVLGLFMGRTMNKGGDGLNHQGGIGVTFDANTLVQITNTGQTSGHSFDNFLTTNQEGDFIGIDLGDNYPRGINLHRMTKDSRRSRLVYTFKTLHGNTADRYGKTFPPYPEISNQKQKFYKWSNDNNTYTELGGVVEVADGYLVIFGGEPDSTGKALNNSRFGNKSDVRNLGFVKVTKDFYAYSQKNFILSKGITEKGGFYTFGGSWTEQVNQGINWLTKYKKDNASNIKTQLLPNGNVLILWSKEPAAYSTLADTQAMMMCIDSEGKIIQGPVELGSDLIFDRRDEVLLIDKKIFSVTAQDNKLQVCYLELK